jgi:ABC-2 type transport system permease protein
VRRVLTVIREEYRRQVLRKQFIGMLLAPVLIFGISLIVGFIAASQGRGSDGGVVGYVDPQAVLARTVFDSNPKLTFKPFETRAAAAAALESEKIIAAYVLDPAFVTNGAVEVLYWKNRPSGEVGDAFRAAIRAELTAGLNADARQRLDDGPVLIHQSADGKRNFGREGIVAFLLPLVMGFLFILALAFGSQYLIQAVVDEKENRTIEVIVSALTPFQLMAGKIIGLSAVVMTQLLVWVLTGIVTLLILSRNFSFLADFQLDPFFLLTMLLLFLLQYGLYAAIMAGIGSAVTDLKQAQSVSGPFILLAIAPEFFLPALLLNPNGAVAVILSLIPFTSPFTLALRYGMTSVPIWHFAIAIVLLALTLVAAIWAASKVFRAGILSYGRPMPLSEVFNAIRI